MLNRAPFYDFIRHRLFSGLTPQQVAGMDQLLDAWEAVPPAATTNLRLSESLAYIHAGVYRETGGHMVPCREGCYLAPHGDWPSWTDEQARAFVTRQGYPYAHPEGPPPGIVCYGRGRIQNTWWANMLKLTRRFGVPLTTNPDLLITDPLLDAKVTVYGHLEGLWSGHRLADYFSTTRVPDPLHARHIVNVMDHAQDIAQTYSVFLAAIHAGQQP